MTKTGHAKSSLTNPPNTGLLTWQQLILTGELQPAPQNKNIQNALSLRLWELSPHTIFVLYLKIGNLGNLLPNFHGQCAALFSRILGATKRIYSTAAELRRRLSSEAPPGLFSCETSPLMWSRRLNTRFLFSYELVSINAPPHSESYFWARTNARMSYFQHKPVLTKTRGQVLRIVSSAL